MKARILKFPPAVMLVLLIIGASMCGCGAISYVVQALVPASKGTWVEAKSEALSEGKKVLILVYTSQDIQYQHGQLARLYTALGVAKEMKSKLKVDVVDPITVEKFQASNLNWADRSLSQIGREQYSADLVMYIELHEFTTTRQLFDDMAGPDFFE